MPGNAVEFLTDGLTVGTAIYHVMHPVQLRLSGTPQPIPAELLINGVEIGCGGSQLTDLSVSDP
ncbi:hypothetical protein ACPEIF_22890 [Streptomyces sp. NPDC012600]|uniref:hypothetical protein n=1 Tax=Streptomyces sp. NPDC012600 TaxID=3415005 RepID=UPI003C2FBE51